MQRTQIDLLKKEDVSPVNHKQAKVQLTPPPINAKYPYYALNGVPIGEKYPYSTLDGRRLVLNIHILR